MAILPELAYAGGADVTAVLFPALRCEVSRWRRSPSHPPTLAVPRNGAVPQR